MRRYLRSALLVLVLAPVTFAVTLALSFPVAVRTAATGMDTGGTTLPVVYGLAGASAALGASWTSNTLARGRTRAKLGPVFLWTEVTALTMVLLAPASSLEGLVEVPFFVEIFVAAVAMALSATILSLRLREPGTGRWRDVLPGLLAAAAATLAPLLVLSEACPYIGCSL